MSDDLPTQSFDTSGGHPETGRDSPTQAQKSRKLFIIFASVGGVLLIAVLVVLILVLTKPGEPVAAPTTTSSPTPRTTTAAPPSASPTPAPSTPVDPPPPPNSDAAVEYFDIQPARPDCTAGEDPIITIRWETSNADTVYFGIDTDDASAGPYFSGLPASGNSDTDFPSGNAPFRFSCNESGSHTYALTAVNDDGTKDTVVILIADET